MAEEAEDVEEDFVGGRAAGPPKRYKRHYEECNSRLDELAKPRKWYLLSTYHENLQRFDPERLEKMRARIQEEFSLTPEETEKYMERFKRKVMSDWRKRELRKEMKKQKKLGKRMACVLFRKYVKRGMVHACRYPPPAIASPVVNAVSDAFLQMLAEIHAVRVPTRRDSDKMSQFLIANADWLAIIVCGIYYEVEVEEKRELERIKLMEEQLAKGREMESKPPDDSDADESTAEEEAETEEEQTDQIVKVTDMGAAQAEIQQFDEIE